jgi:hypothetical protein
MSLDHGYWIMSLVDAREKERRKKQEKTAPEEGLWKRGAETVQTTPIMPPFMIPRSSTHKDGAVGI